MIYQAVFERADDGSIFAYVPDLPGCTGWGATIDDAATSVAAAAKLWVNDAREKGEPVPHSSTIATRAIEVAAA